MSTTLGECHLGKRHSIAILPLSCIVSEVSISDFEASRDPQLNRGEKKSREIKGKNCVQSHVETNQTEGKPLPGDYGGGW